MFRWIPIALVACGTQGPLDVPDPSEDPLEPFDACTDADCIQAGDHRFEFEGSSRDVRAFFPEDPTNAPVLFVWHHLSGSPEELLSWMPVQDATEAGFIVIVPESRALFGTEWDVLPPANSNIDVALFDALADRVIAQGADPDHLYATGFSAGGLFTSFLTMHRADRLAATAPFSGGAPAGSYASPATGLPVMLHWGGPSDTFGGFDFEDATQNLAAELLDDGHVVLECDHGLGHWLPNDAAQRLIRFVSDHAASGEVTTVNGCERLDP